jgi:hypothetical protein
MKRFRRWLLNALAAMSLLFCAAIAVIWVRGGFVGTNRFLRVVGRWEYTVDGSHQPYGSKSIQIVFVHEAAKPVIGPPLPANGIMFTNWLRHFPPDHSFPTHHGFAFEYGPEFGGSATNALMLGKRIDLSIPYWAIVILLLIPPLIWAAKLRQQQRSVERNRVDICRRCGYDLRATPDRCPECGAIPPKKEMISN